MAEKTIEFRNFQNAQVPLEVVAGHLTMDLKTKPQMCDQERQRRIQFFNHLQKTLVTPPEDSDHHHTDTAHSLTDVSSCHFQASSLPNYLAYRVYWRSRPVELLPVRRGQRRPVNALAHRMRHEDDVSIMVSGNPDFGEKGRTRARQELRQEEEELEPQRTEPALERNIPVGQPQVKEALIRDLLH